MKTKKLLFLLFLSLGILPFSLHANSIGHNHHGAVALKSSWIKLGETKHCPFQIEILASKEKDFVIAISSDWVKRLISPEKKRFVFQREAEVIQVFHSDLERDTYRLGEPTLKLEVPPFTDPLPFPSLEITLSGTALKCTVDQYFYLNRDDSLKRGK